MDHLSKTLTQLEKKDWGPASPDDSRLIQTCHTLRYKPLQEFEIEDLRIMIGQDISLKFLIPIALDRLTNNILAEGDLYEGDLLSSVLTSDSQYWKDNKAQWELVKSLFTANQDLFTDYNLKHIRKGFAEFSKSFPTDSTDNTDLHPPKL